MMKWIFWGFIIYYVYTGVTTTTDPDIIQLRLEVSTMLTELATELSPDTDNRPTPSIEKEIITPIEPVQVDPIQPESTETPKNWW